MLLHIMTLSWNICRHDPPRAQPHPARLALPRIRLLGFRDADFQADALHLRPVYKRWRGLFAERLRFAAFAHHLHECGGRMRCAGKCAVVGCEGSLWCCAAENGLCGFDGRAEEAGYEGELHFGRVLSV